MYRAGCAILGHMQWHWGNIGSAAAGLATLIVTVRLLWSAPDWYRTWKERQNAERDLAREQAEDIRLDRRRSLSGWSGSGVNTYPVALVTTDDEFDQARAELAGGLPTVYVVMRVTGATEGGSANLAHQLRQTVETQGFISRPPAPGEREALEAGLDSMGIPRATFK